MNTETHIKTRIKQFFHNKGLHPNLATELLSELEPISPSPPRVTDDATRELIETIIKWEKNDPYEYRACETILREKYKITKRDA